MDQAVNYGDILTCVLRERGALQPSLQPIRVSSVCDPETGRFLLVATGKSNAGRVEIILFHARLADGKVVIETDNFEEGLSEYLIDAGIPRADILSAQAFERMQEEKSAAA